MSGCVWSSNATPYSQKAASLAAFVPWLTTVWQNQWSWAGFWCSSFWTSSKLVLQYSLLVQDLELLCRTGGTAVCKPKAWSCRRRQVCMYKQKAFMQWLHSFYLCNISHVSIENTKPTDNIVPTAWEGKAETVCPLIFCKSWKRQPSSRTGEMSCAGTNLQPGCRRMKRFFKSLISILTASFKVISCDEASSFKKTHGINKYLSKLVWEGTGYSLPSHTHSLSVCLSFSLPCLKCSFRDRKLFFQ